MLKGNRGEWSEIYVFLYLASEGKMYAADSNLQELSNDAFIPIVRIIRKEKNSPKISYYTGDPISIRSESGNTITQIAQSDFKQQARNLYYEITSLNHNSGSFPVPQTEAFMNRIFVRSLKAPSNDKADIVMQIQDARTGIDPIFGWSIKSELGNPPTLLNAGKTTNFVFAARGIDDYSAAQINSISTRAKIKDRLIAIVTVGSIGFLRASNATFSRNLRLIDSLFPQIIAESLIRYYLGEGPDCKTIVKSLEDTDPLGLGKGMYVYKFKKFLCAVALGMKPSYEWDGRDDATGGYVVVREDGKVLAFHVYNRDMFEDYLLDNTRFETASTSRHEFGELYKTENGYSINLNLQIRFK